MWQLCQNGKEIIYKKVCCMCKGVVLLIKRIVFFFFDVLVAVASLNL